MTWGVLVSHILGYELGFYELLSCGLVYTCVKAAR